MIRASVLSEDVVERHLEELEEAVDDNQRSRPRRILGPHELQHDVFAARRRVGAYRAHDRIEGERPARVGK